MPNYHKPIIIDRATEIYRAVLLECERRRQELGWSMWQLDDAAGLNDGHFGHCLHCDRPTGRQASWKILNLIVTALWPRGFDLRVTDKPGGALTAEGMHMKIRHAAADHSRIGRRDLMRELGKKGAAARWIKYRALPREERLAIAAKARKTRRANRLARAQNGKHQPQSRKLHAALEPCVVPSVSSGPSSSLDGIPAE
jgi:hypothetical protein